MNTVIVTGSSGFIGRQVVRTILDTTPYIVYGFDLKPSDITHHRFKELISLNGQITEFMNDFKAPSYFIHCAAQIDVVESMLNPLADATSNIFLTINLLQSLDLTECRAFTYINSGGAIYSPFAELPLTENSTVDPQSFYGLSKFVAEKYVEKFCHLHSIPWSSLALSNVYGHLNDNRKGVIFLFASKMLRGDDIVLFGKETTRDFIHVQDVVDAVIKSLAKPTNCRIHISSGVETSIEDLFLLIKECLGVQAHYRNLPMRAGEVARSVLDNSKAREFLEWEPRIDLKTGLRLSIL